MRRLPSPPSPRVLAAALSILLAATGARADLQAELDGMFDSMTNVTAPLAHMGQRRGVLAGGSVVTRNHIVEANPVSIVPPSFSAGCGGIDLFAGSFSFVNATQFVQMLRSVASNAAGYAFEVALGNMCKECLQSIETLARKIQALNQHFGNSCRLAKGVVNDTLDAFDIAHKDRTSLIGLRKGIGDVFDVFSDAGGEDPGARVEAGAPAEARRELHGNLVWRALRSQGAEGWFRFGDVALLEAMMSLTGTLVVGPPVAAPDGEGSSARITTYPPLELTVSDLVNGSGSGPGRTVRVYRCTDTSADGCLAPVASAVALRGLREQVREVLLGGVGGVGLVEKFALGVADLSDREKGFLEVTGGLGGALERLARRDRSVARLFAERAAPVIAVDLVGLLVREAVRAVRLAEGTDSNAWAPRLEALLGRAAAEVEAERRSLERRYGNTGELLAYYSDVLSLLEARGYAHPPEVSAARPAR